MRTNQFVAVWLSLALLTFFPNASAGQTSGTMQTGYIRLVANGAGAPDGVAIFGLRTNGILITEAGVPSTTTIQSGRIFVDVAGPVNTGIALANPGNTDAVISYYFTDGSGNDFGASSFTLGATHQVATFLTNAPFGLTSSLARTFTFTSSSPVTAIALRSFVNERSEVLLTTLPVSPLSSGFGGNALLIPHFADGAGWTTQIVLLNPGNAPLSGTIQFFGQGSKYGSAQPTKVVINGVTNSTFNYTVAPRSAVRMLTQQARYATQIGSVRIKPGPTSGTPSGLAIFSYQQNGVTVSAASVPALPTATGFRMYIESSGVFGQIGSIQTGVTISNPGSTHVTVQMDVMKLDGTPTGLSTSLDIPAGGQIARYANQLFLQLPANFRGVLRMTAPRSVAVIGLRGRYNERGELLMTTTPPYNDAAAAVPEIYFPHIANGAGFSTQLILLSTGSAQTGTLWLLSSDGLPLSGTSLQPTP